MIETKPRINRGNRGQLFRATWLSSARCNETLGTLRYETRRLLDAAGSKLSQTSEVAHVQSVVLLASRRVEDVGWQGLAFCVKREYFILLEFTHLNM